MQVTVFILQRVDVVFELAILGVDRLDVRIDIGLAAAAGEDEHSAGCKDVKAHEP
jgi:hypothetical protein